MTRKTKRLAIIGSGISGLTIANTLQDVFEITLFEKSRQVGGRMATRRYESYQFDHGAQFFTVKSQQFKQFLQPYIEQKILVPWFGRFVEFANGNITYRKDWNDSYPHYVASPGMNALAKQLATNFSVKLSTRITSIQRKQNKWLLFDENSNVYDGYDWIICTTPVAQTLSIIPQQFIAYSQLEATIMSPCFSLMLGFATEFKRDWDIAMVLDEIISWCSFNYTKPGRSSAVSMVVMSTNRWAASNIELDKEAVKNQLLQQVQSITKLPLDDYSHIDLHLWRYANSPINKAGYFIDHELNLGVCGDWCIKGRVESAFTSGFNLATEIYNLVNLK